MEYQNLLSAGAIQQILDNAKPANPVLQVIGYKPMAPDQMTFGTATDDLRYRLMIGDGIKAHQYCVITNQDLVEDIKCGRLEKWSVIKVTSYQTVDYGDGPPENKRRLIYILNLELIKKGSEVGHKIVCQEPTSNQQIGQQNIKPQQFNSPQSGNANHNPSSNNPMNTSNNQTQPQPYPMGGVQPEFIRSPRVARGPEHQTINIGELTPYIGKWVVKGRVIAKSAIREYNNAKGGGKLYNFTISDKSGEIKVTAFNADCDRTYSYVEPDKIYLLGRATVKSADKRYTTADYEITLNNDSLLEEISESKDTSDIPKAKFNCPPISQISSLPIDRPADLMGAIINVGEPSTIISKTKNKELKKREITIVDMSRHTISVTLWGEQSETFSGVIGDVFATKNARFSLYAGRSASAGDSFSLNPPTPEARKLKNWYDKLIDSNFTHLTQAQESSTSSDQWKTLDQLMDMNQARNILSSGNQSAAYAKCKATLMMVGKNPVYKCCPTENCGKKLIDTQNNELKCEKCQQTFTSFKYRYMTNVEICDARASTWTTLWDEKAETILGMKPDGLEALMKAENKDAYERVINRANFNSYIFTFRIRIDNYNNEEKVRLNVINMKPLEPKSYAKRLMEEIRAMS